jgi:hypothetical protein
VPARRCAEDDEVIAIASDRERHDLGVCWRDERQPERLHMLDVVGDLFVAVRVAHQRYLDLLRPVIVGDTSDDAAAHEERHASERRGELAKDAAHDRVEVHHRHRPPRSRSG